MAKTLDTELRIAMMTHISDQLRLARDAYKRSREYLAVQNQRLYTAKKYLSPASVEVGESKSAVSRALRLVNFARKRLIEAIRFAEIELGKPKRQFFRPKKARKTVLELFEVSAVAA